MNFDDYATQHARLTILKELARQNDLRTNEAFLERVLDSVGYRRSREWIRTQLRKLEELDALKVMEVGNLYVAEIGRAGLDHVERRSFIEGVARPGPTA